MNKRLYASLITSICLSQAYGSKEIKPYDSGYEKGSYKGITLPKKEKKKSRAYRRSKK